MHERQHTGHTMSQVISEFREGFNKAPPRKATLLDLEKRTFALGSVKDRPRSGRKTTCLEICAAVAASIERSSMNSTWTRSSELGVPWSTMRVHMKKDLNVRPYRPTFVNELSTGDMDLRYESCRALLYTFSNAVSSSKFLFNDECAIYRSARTRNVAFWSKENPYFTQELEYNPPPCNGAGDCGEPRPFQEPGKRSFKSSPTERAKCGFSPSCCSHTSSWSPMSLS